MAQSIRTIIRRISARLIAFNSFESEATRSSPFHLRIAIISTRIYLVLFTVGIAALTTYTSLSQQTQSATIRNPSIKTYYELFDKYSTTLSCPCSSIYNPYSGFVSVSPTYHTVCSSWLVSDAWINLLFNENISFYYELDFRSSASGHFQLLASFCSLAKRSVEDAMKIFFNETLLSTDVLDQRAFDAESKARISFMQISVKNGFRRLLLLVRGTTHNNMLQPALRTAMHPYIYTFPDGNKQVTARLDNYYYTSQGQKCSCDAQATCSTPSGFYNLFAYDNREDFLSSTPAIFNVTGFVVGCYAIESLIQSTLECFYNQTCLKTVLTFVLPSACIINEFYPLNETRFSPQTPIGTLIDELFIENWTIHNLFSLYFNQCLPISCTYTYPKRNNAFYVLTTILTVYNGLMLVLRLCIPLVVTWWYSRRLVQVQTVHAHVSILERFRQVRQWIRTKLLKLNLFETADTLSDPFKLRTSLIATRIFFVLLCVSFIFLAVDTTLGNEPQIITVKNASKATFDDLYTKYSSTLQCPCIKISIKYESFVSLSPKQHPICSSSFTTDAWIDLIRHVDPPDMVFTQDFRIVGRFFFSTLASLCSLSRMTLFNSWHSFNQSMLVTDQVIFVDELIARAQSAFDRMKSNTITEFKHDLALIQAHTNTLLSRIQTNAKIVNGRFFGESSIINFYTLPVELEECLCAVDLNCVKPIGFFDVNMTEPVIKYRMSFEIPKLYLGCFITQATLQSTLECFFNQTCLDIIQSNIQSDRSINASILQENDTRFSPEMMVSMIVDELMLEQWGENIDYNKYYEDCAPKFCSYTSPSGINVLYIFATVIGLLGGLSAVLRVLVPSIVSFIRERIHLRANTNNQPARPSLTGYLRRAWNWLKKIVLELNIFDDEASWGNEVRRRTKIIATRIYFVLLIVIMISFISYMAISIRTVQITVHKPSQQHFERLQSDSRFSPTLDCQCQNITVPYGRFISITPQLHQICSSDFVSREKWMDVIYLQFARPLSPDNQYPVSALSQFQLLAAFCTVANDTISNALEMLRSTTLVTIRAHSRQTIENQMNAVVAQFRSSLSEKFVRSIDFIQRMAQGNSIISSTMSNWYLMHYTSIDDYSLWSIPEMYGDNNCSCGTNSMCSLAASILFYVVPGSRIGCYASEALLQSTLECLYQSECIDELKNMYFKGDGLYFRALNSSISSPNATVQTLVDRLLVDRWETSVVYDRYYSSCAPISCTYSTSAQLFSMNIVKAVIGFYGGLTALLEIIVPIMTKIGLKFVRCRRRRVANLSVATVSS